MNPFNFKHFLACTILPKDLEYCKMLPFKISFFIPFSTSKLYIKDASVPDEEPIWVWNVLSLNAVKKNIGEKGAVLPALGKHKLLQSFLLNIIL